MSLPTAPCAVLLATYNGQKYIRELLDSLVAQTHKNFTVIARDDGSTDLTLHILKEYSSRLDIDVVEDGARLGPAASFLELLRRAGDRFEFFFFADQDDYWQAEKIERAASWLSDVRDGVALYCSRVEYVDQSLRHLQYSRNPRVIALENALVENVAFGCTVAITRPARRFVLEHMPDRVIMHDWWMYLTVVAFGRVLYDDMPWIKYRQHDGNVVGAPTSSLRDYSQRVRRFFRRDGGAFRLSEQAREFERCFGGLLRHDQKELVEGIRLAKEHGVGRMRIAFGSRFVRQRPLDTLMLRCLFLLGRF